MPRKKPSLAQKRARALFTKRYGKKKGAGSRVAGGSSVAGRTRRRVVRRKPRKKASGSSVAGRTRRKPAKKRAGGKWKDRILWLPNQAVKQTFGRLAKSIWKRNR